MKKLLVAVFVSLFAMGAYAQTTSADSCEARAVSRWQTLYGAAKAASIKKCEQEKRSATSCEALAVSKDGKPLYGAAKASSIKKCEQERAGVTGKKTGKK